MVDEIRGIAGCVVEVAFEMLAQRRCLVVRARSLSSVTMHASVSLNSEWSFRLAEPMISRESSTIASFGVHVDRVGDGA